MNKDKILITGITGFIGRQVALLLKKKKVEITALIRPGTAHSRISDFQDYIKFVEIDLTDVEKLRDFLDLNSFKKIVHIGAIRGGRCFPKEDYLKANVHATEQLLIHAQKNNSKFIFCSSVGVFGAIPVELPANNTTTRQNDNYYHFTKIQAESIVQNYVLNGVNAVIVRPSITYGIGDYGFPFTLIKLVDKKMMLLPDKPVKINMTNVTILAEAFYQLIDTDVEPGKAYIVADKEPVALKDIVNFISEKIHKKPYPTNRTISHRYFRKGEKIATSLKNDLWKNRFQLISRSWYYDTEDVFSDLSLRTTKTIPEFKTVIDWYQSLKKKKK